MTESAWTVPDVDFEAQVEVMAALADATRLLILHVLREEGERCVTDIMKRTEGVSQPSVSKHLAALKKAGLVDRDKRGREVFYALADGTARLLGAVEAFEGGEAAHALPAAPKSSPALPQAQAS